MRNVLLFVAVISIGILTSCESKVFKKSYVFDDLRLPYKEYSFEYDNVSAKQEYDVILMFRYIHGFNANQMVFDVTLQTELNDTINSVLGLRVRDKKGGYIGEGSGDIWDIEKRIMTSVRLPKGKNTFILKHAMPQDTVNYVQEIGIKIVESTK